MVPTRKRPDRRHLTLAERQSNGPGTLPTPGDDRPQPLSRPTGVLVGEINQFLRGWGPYFRFGNSTRHFHALDEYVVERMALLLSKRHGRRGRGNKLKHIVLSGNRLGLVLLSGSVRWE